MSRGVPFQPAASFGEAIRKTATERLAESQKQLVESMMAPENVLHYSHGSSWKNPALPDSIEGEMKTHTAEFALPFQRLVDGDLAVVQESIEGVALQMKYQFLQSVYGLMNETCERTGNTVSASEAGGFPEAFERMLQKIEFGVDSKGNVSLPTMHVGDAGPLTAALEAQPDEYRARIESLINEKKETALAKEKVRKSKFLEQP